MTADIRLLNLETEVSRLRAMLAEQGRLLNRLASGEAEMGTDECVWRRVVRMTCAEFGVPAARVLSCDRTKAIAEARQVAHYLLKVGLGWTCQRAGEAALRDHGTIQHSVRAVDAILSIDGKFKASVERLMKEVRA